MKKQRNDRKVQTKPGLIEKTNAFFDRHEKGLVFLSMVLGITMCILLFDVKVSLSGDDCDFLVGAEEFWLHFRYPGYHGALYPIVISPFIGIFGYNLILIKSIGCIFTLTFLWLFYKGFKGKVPNIILIPSLILVSINSYLFFYASQTYSEALFMFIQGLFFYYLFKHFIDKEEGAVSLKSDWKKYAILSLLILLMGLTRSIGYVAIGVLILFFVIQRQWKSLLYSIAALCVVFLFFYLFKSIVWPTAASGGGYSISTLLAKDYYNPIEQESLSGLCSRFIENSNIYISNFLCQFLGIIKEQPSNYIDMNVLRTIVLYIFFFVSLSIVFKKNKYIFFSGIYAGVMLFGTFIILHSFWAQDRMILVFYPFILILFLGGLYYLLQIKIMKKFFFIYPVVLVILFIGTFSITKNRIARNVPVLQQNILGDQLYGLTPDWQNFIKASQWAAKNLDPAVNIMSRKATISKVYTGRDFVGDPQAIATPLDSLLQLKNTDEHTIVVIAENNQYDFQSPFFEYLIGAKDNALIINDQSVRAAFLYIVPNTEVEGFVQYLSESQLNCTLDYESFMESCKKASDQLRIFDPDVMLKYLIDSGIDYLLLAQLRIDPTQNTGVYLNSIHRFVWYVSYKYPEAFRRVHTIGKDEPCEIVQFVH